ncbi:membrane bound O-acyl transferase family-domain-containing protein [Trametes punicea]|nr:membrane bound O-acyl transferase family-domain-containing protein [Trametes punicea]
MTVDASATAAMPSERPPLPIPAFVLLPDVILACIMALRPPFVVKIGASLLLLCAPIYACATYTAGGGMADYLRACVIFGNMLFNIMLLTWLTDPIKDFHYIKDPTPLTQKAPLARIWDAFCIIRNWRLIGMNVQVANIPPPFQGTRAQFLMRGFRQLVTSFIALDALLFFIHTHHHLYIADSSSSHLPAGALGYVMRSGCTAIYLLTTWFIMKLCYALVSTAAVATGLWGPEDWPDLLGPASEAYTVRRSWGRVWHQLLRRHFSRWGNLAVDTLGISRGTWLSSQVQVHVAFNLSGLLHCLGDLMVGKEWVGRSWIFFALNGLAITFEDTVIALAKRNGFGRASGDAGPTRAMRILGYVWVYSCMTYSGWFYSSYLWETRRPLADPMRPYSPISNLVLPFIWRITGTM